MRSGGYIKLKRDVFDSDFLGEEKFSRREAWIWLLCSAYFSPAKYTYRAQDFDIQRGELPTSYRKLAEIWKWSKDKVKYFMSHLENSSKITSRIRRPILILSICNYDEISTTVEEQKDTRLYTNQDANQDTSNKKSKEDLRTKEKDTTLVVVSKKKKNASRIPPDFGEEVAVADWPIKNLGWGSQLAKLELEKFKDYWMAAPQGTKLDWMATWRNWCRNCRSSAAPPPKKEPTDLNKWFKEKYGDE